MQNPSSPCLAVTCCLLSFPPLVSHLYSPFHLFLLLLMSCVNLDYGPHFTEQRPMMPAPYAGPLASGSSSKTQRRGGGGIQKASLGRQSSSGGTPTGFLLKAVKSPKHPFDTTSVGLQNLSFLPDLPVLKEPPTPPNWG